MKRLMDGELESLEVLWMDTWEHRAILADLRRYKVALEEIKRRFRHTDMDGCSPCPVCLADQALGDDDADALADYEARGCQPKPVPPRKMRHG